MEQERDDQVIYFKDLIFSALYQWRRIIVVTLVMAVLFGAFSLIKNSFQKDIPAQSAADQEKIALKEQLLSDLDVQIRQQETYLNESILMSLDVHEVHRSVVTVYVDASSQIVTGESNQEADRTALVLGTYQTFLYDKETMSGISESLAVPTKYLSELLQIDDSNLANGMFTITISYTNAEGAEQIAQAIVAYLEQIHPQVEQLVKSHDLTVLTHNTGIQSDISLTDKQIAAKQQLADMQANRSAVQAELSALANPLTAQDPIRFSIIGAVIGAFATVCIACVYHMVSGKVYSDRVLQNRTGIKILATMPSTSKKHPVDKWLCSLENRATSSDQINIAARAILNYCSSCKLLMIAGDSDPKSREPLVAALAELGVTLCDCGSLNTSEKALEKLPQCDAVLLVEQCGKTKYKDVSKSILRVTDQNKQLLGCVLLDG